MNVDELLAIDVHTHVQASLDRRGFPPDSPEAAVAEVFGSDKLLNVPELAAFYRERNMAAICFMVDTVRWGGPVTNEEVLQLAAREDNLFPFVSIDPHRPDAAQTARRLIADVTTEGGFPPFLIDPIDFAGVYAARKAQADGVTVGNA